MTMVPPDTLISARDGTMTYLAISQHVNKITMATTTTTTASAPDLLTLVTDTETLVSSIDTLTSYLDGDSAPRNLMSPFVCPTCTCPVNQCDTSHR